MNKREFLAGSLAAGALPGLAGAAAITPAGPVLLTISGDIRRPNRGALDPALDQMMARHKLSFTQAHALDFAALARLPARSIRPTLEYDGKPRSLRGPRLADVLALAGAPAADDTRITLRAVDGYAAGITLRQARAHGFIVATHLDGRPLALGDSAPCGPSTMRTGCRRWPRSRWRSASRPAPGRCITSRWRVNGKRTRPQSGLVRKQVGEIRSTGSGAA